MPDIRSNRETGNALTIGIVLAGIVAALTGWLCLFSIRPEGRRRDRKPAEH